MLVGGPTEEERHLIAGWSRRRSRSVPYEAFESTRGPVAERLPLRGGLKGLRREKLTAPKDVDLRLFPPFRLARSFLRQLERDAIPERHQHPLQYRVLREKSCARQSIPPKSGRISQCQEERTFIHSTWAGSRYRIICRTVVGEMRR